jgi:hypothetical protein
MLSFEAKTMGGRLSVFVAVLAFVMSCGLKEIDSGQNADNGIWTGPGNVVVGGDSEHDQVDKVCYTVGVDYQDGYDWRADMDMGNVKCSLVVYADGIPLVKVPVGDEYETSADPDMHRVIRGSLYTDYAARTETVIKRDGETLFRYSGREMIIGMAVDDGYVYTLGQSRQGGGFSFRRDGEVLFESMSGYLFPRLQRCEDGFSFIFYEPVELEGASAEKYYHYLAGEVCQIAVLEEVDKVWDMVFNEKFVCYIASMRGMLTPVLVSGKEVSPMDVRENAEIRACRFVSADGDMDIEGIMSQEGNVLFSCLWCGARLREVFSPGYTAAAVCVSDTDVACVLNGRRNLSGGVIYQNGRSFDMPEGYMSIGGCAMVIIDGRLYVGLTSETGGPPAVWSEEKIKPLKINGFISHMSVG